MSEAVQVSKRVLVRPFADCTDLLEQRLTVRTAPDSEFTANAVITELPESFTLSCKLAFDAKEVAHKSAIEVDELALVAVLTVKSIKLSVAINRFQATDIKNDAILTLNDERIRKLPAGTPFTIDLALVLCRERPYKLGAPWLPGHWMGRKTLTFNSVPHGRSFNIQPIPAGEFPKRFLLPKESFYYVQCSQDDLTADRETFQKNVTVYIRDDCYNSLASGGQSPSVNAVFKQMEADIVAQISIKALQGATDAMCLENNVRGMLLKQLKKKMSVPVEQLARISQNEPERFRALVQGMCKLGPTMSKTIYS